MDFIHGMSAQDLGGLLAGSMGVIGVAIWWIMEHHVLKGSDKVEEAIDAAQYSVIDMLRKEVERMSESNKQLGLGLAQFQAENLELRREISDLHDTISELSERINLLSKSQASCDSCIHNYANILSK